MNTPFGPIPDPTLSSVLQQVRDEIFSNFNCHQLGQIVSFDPSNQTASVEIKMLRQVPDLKTKFPSFNTVKYPVLEKCPVFILSGGTGYVTFPIAPGDPCLVLFNDRNIDDWYSTGNTAVPPSSRMHDFSDGLVLVGFRNKSNRVPNYDEDSAVFAFNGGKVKLDDKVAFDGMDSTLRAVLESVVVALTALNLKTGPSAAVQITAVTTEINKLLQ